MLQLLPLALALGNLHRLGDTAVCTTTTVSADSGRPKRICLLGLFGMENYGNDGSLEAILMFLRQTWPDALYSCVCIKPQKVQHDHRLPAISISWPGFASSVLRFCDKITATLPHKLGNWIQAISHLRKFDVLIVPGTSTLCDYRASPFGAPYAIFRWAVSARLCGTKLCFVSTGAGPIQHRLSRWMLTYVAKSACYRSFRDGISRDFLAGLGIDTRHDAIYPDLAFKLPTPQPIAAPASQSSMVTVGIGMMSYNGWHGHTSSDDTIYTTYLMKMARFTGLLLDRGYRVRLLVGEASDQRAVADLQTALALQGYTSPSGQVITDPVNSLHDLMRQMEDNAVVVASRFHNVICALKLARPTISIGYEAKHDALMREMGLGDFCQHIEHLDVNRLMQQTTQLMGRASAYEEQIREKLLDIESRIAEQELHLRRIL
jgi:polysaccharide pyruvyl transferase WcaK-like protein